MSNKIQAIRAMSSKVNKKNIELKLSYNDIVVSEYNTWNICLNRNLFISYSILWLTIFLEMHLIYRKKKSFQVPNSMINQKWSLILKNYFLLWVSGNQKFYWIPTLWVHEKKIIVTSYAPKNIYLLYNILIILGDYDNSGSQSIFWLSSTALCIRVFFFWCISQHGIP